jgi:hemerythrin superfamily protein
VQITEDRRKRVIDLYFNQHKSYAEIVQIERISPRDIHAIIKEEQARRQKYKDRQQQEEISSKAYKLFSEKKSPIELAITLSLREPEATKLFIEYCKLKRLHILISLYKETNGELGPFLKLCKVITQRGMSIEQVVNALDIAGDKLPYMESLYGQAKDQAEKMQCTRQYLSNDIQALENKISILDATAFSCEQDCRRKKQELCELKDKKDTIEKLITNILNNDNEGYSKLKQIVKENIKAVLAENKKLISLYFAAIIQTLKTIQKLLN